MRAEIKTEGGVAYFPGLSRPSSVETGQLAEEQDRELKRLVRTARFFDLPDTVGKPRPGAADYRTHTVTIEDEGKAKTVKVVEPIEQQELSALVRYLRALVRSPRSPG